MLMNACKFCDPNQSKSVLQAILAWKPSSTWTHWYIAWYYTCSSTHSQSDSESLSGEVTAETPDWCDHHWLMILLSPAQRNIFLSFLARSQVSGLRSQVSSIRSQVSGLRFANKDDMKAGWVWKPGEIQTQHKAVSNSVSILCFIKQITSIIFSNLFRKLSNWFKYFAQKQAMKTWPVDNLVLVWTGGCWMWWHLR